MEKKRRKRKKPEAEHDQQQYPKSKWDPRSATTNTSSLKDPYPSHTRPSPQECLAVRDTLLAFHGFPPEFAKYRRNKPQQEPTDLTLQPDDPPESVLDGLVRTVLSQNTTESNSLRIQFFVIDSSLTLQLLSPFPRRSRHCKELAPPPSPPRGSAFMTVKTCRHRHEDGSKVDWISWLCKPTYN